MGWFRRSTVMTTVAGALALWATNACADVGFGVHFEGTAARMLGPRKVDQFGWGGAALIAPELKIGSRLGFEVALGGVGLAEGSEQEPGFAENDAGSAFFAIPGVRLRPFGLDDKEGVLNAGGLWFAAGGGVAATGQLARAIISVRAGYDLSAGFFHLGPHIGFMQIIETSSNVRPEDARILLFGFHGSWEPRAREPAKPPPAVDNDRDKDGYPNDLDGCPDAPEDFDKFEDEDGCPDVDNDKDGILDTVDDCPLQPEDVDGFQDDDGCPDPDNDKDGILDKVDDCPNDPETFNGYADKDGCPDEVKVRVTGSEIVLDERVYFRINSSQIEMRSWGLINNVAKLLKANRQYTLVRVQGHADDTGDEKYNEQLSARRSKAVIRMLVQFGVKKKRLTVEAFGESRPADPGTSVYARRKNRRVEFHILKRKPRKGEKTPAAKKQPTNKQPSAAKPTAPAAPKKP